MKYLALWQSLQSPSPYGDLPYVGWCVDNGQLRSWKSNDIVSAVEIAEVLSAWRAWLELQNARR
jgi:hypothetical protein